MKLYLFVEKSMVQENVLFLFVLKENSKHSCFERKKKVIAV